MTIARVAVGALGLLLLLAGAGMLVALGPAGLLPAAFTFGTGAVLLIAVGIERSRYRSLPADTAGGPPGPGGGEPTGAALEPRFQDAFVEAIPLPHSADAFPHLAEILDAAAGYRRARGISDVMTSRNRRRMLAESK